MLVLCHQNHVKRHNPHGPLCPDWELSKWQTVCMMGPSQIIKLQPTLQLIADENKPRKN